MKVVSGHRLRSVPPEDINSKQVTISLTFCAIIIQRKAQTNLTWSSCAHSKPHLQLVNRPLVLVRLLVQPENNMVATSRPASSFSSHLVSFSDLSSSLTLPWAASSSFRRPRYSSWLGELRALPICPTGFNIVFPSSQRNVMKLQTFTLRMIHNQQ